MDKLLANSDWGNVKEICCAVPYFMFVLLVRCEGKGRDILYGFG